MLIDFQSFTGDPTFDADLCIVGAGAAGITIARELLQSRLKVVVVESGGLDFDPEIQSLYRGEIKGAPYPDLDIPRLRFFGGTTNHWDGHCRPLDAIDFERRPWVPYSGWPIDRKVLDPYYARAQAVCELGRFNYVASEWPGLAEWLVPFGPRLTNRMWQFSPPTRFGEKYRDELDRSSNVHILINANAVDVQVVSSGLAVDQIKLKSLSGQEGQVRAKAYVVACGGIENPRLLLDSNGVERDGIGNRRGLVGRYFLEHPHAIIAYAVPQTALDRYMAYYGSVDVDGISIQVKPGVSEDVQRREEILNGCIDVGYGYDRSPGYLSFYNIVRNLRRGRLPNDLDASLIQVLTDLDGTASGLYRQLRGRSVLWFGANFEQAPNPDSRVMLSAQRDPLGCRRAALDWRLSEIDKRSLRAGCRIVGEELARLGLARMKMDAWLLKDDSMWDDLKGHFHHMGTTRMNDDPASGVVDANCRVHGVSNLYVAGSSVFPTCGYANATLTIVALSLRLADHLREKVRV